ncbi:MAG: type II secretion system secretin GspD [Pseudobdellovibrionaceae bacterium]|nr:type II secretion system secretin GspD [Bdellovibrionales bacterium]USN47717.1 MAG: type II secretion system secretin GspD [Pseudobdellovibrionaceae bacterium]
MKYCIAIMATLLLAQTVIPHKSLAQDTPDEATSSTEPQKEDKMPFADAKPEDITNENFPKLIESFVFPDAEIREVVKAIAKLTGKNFIVHSQVRGKISILADTPITVAEAYKAFLSALAMTGYTVVPSGNFLKVISSRDAKRDSIETYSGRYFPVTDQLITRIVKLKYISAEELKKKLRNIVSKEGEMEDYALTNSLIITDYGSNIERFMGIVNQLDVPGFEERLEVITIKYAKAKDISDLIDEIINKGQPKNQRFTSSRFSRTNQAESSSSGAESFSHVIPDQRTNSIIVVGNEAGIQKIRALVKKLDFKLRPEDSGGVYVYYIRHGEAESISKILSGIASDSTKAQSDTGTKTNTAAPPTAQPQAIFGGDVKITADPDNNSLIVSASPQDYEVVKNLLAKIDIPRDQVYVKAIIMEMEAQKSQNVGINYYKFVEGTDGVGRIGFRGTTDVASLIDPAGDSGAIISLGDKGNLTTVKIAGQELEVPNLLGLIKILKKSVGANVLSEPQIMALDNQEALIEVGDEVPVGVSQALGTGTTPTTASIERKKATIKLNITPFISPDTDTVRLNIKQSVSQLSKKQVEASELAKAAVITNERNIETSIVVNSGDTAVLGGLMTDKEDETVFKVPILGDLPILGWLFKSRETSKSKSNLVVFITPKIIRNAQDGSDVIDVKLKERIDFIRQNLQGRDPHGHTIDNLPRRAFNSSPTTLDEEPLEEPALETF